MEKVVSDPQWNETLEGGGGRKVKVVQHVSVSLVKTAPNKF